MTDETIPGSAKSAAPDHGFRRAATASPIRSAILQLVGLLVLLLALAAFWHFLPIAGLTHVGRLEAFAHTLQQHWAGPLAVIAGFVVGGLVMFPLVLMVVATGMLYDPVTGCVVAMTGAVLSASCGYGLGQVLGSSAVRRLAGAKLDRLQARLGHRDILAIAAIRFLPILPFTIVNMAVGAARFSFWDFIIGTMLGLAPGILAATFFASEIAHLGHGGTLRVVVLGAAILVAAGLILLLVVRRRGRSCPR